VTHRLMGVNGEAPAYQPPTRSPSPHRVRMAVAEVQMRAVRGPCARRGVLDAGVGSRRDVMGAHRSKERLSASAQRGRRGLVVESLQGASHAYGKNRAIRSTVRGRAEVAHLARGLGTSGGGLTVELYCSMLI